MRALRVSASLSTETTATAALGYWVIGYTSVLERGSYPGAVNRPPKLELASRPSSVWVPTAVEIQIRPRATSTDRIGVHRCVLDTARSSRARDNRIYRPVISASGNDFVKEAIFGLVGI